jgi:hypothetical protein
MSVGRERHPRFPFHQRCFGVPGRSRAFPSRFGDGYAVCYTTGTNDGRWAEGGKQKAQAIPTLRFHARRPRQADLNPGRRPQTCTEPLPVPETGGALPPHVSGGSDERTRTAVPFGARPSTQRVRLVSPRGEYLVPGEGFAPPSPRCERGILLLEEPGKLDAGLRVARSLRAYETREATAPALPQRSWWAWEELHLHAGRHPLLRRACLLVPPQARIGGSGRIRTSKDPEGSNRS